MSKKINKQIDYVQVALKKDVKAYPDRSIKDFSELTNLIVSQYQDKTTFAIKQEHVCTSLI
tara:strand:- start:233 stop:415 length:183 start_codon:yes stop_codon:yes gene_type:complete